MAAILGCSMHSYSMGRSSGMLTSTFTGIERRLLMLLSWLLESTTSVFLSGLRAIVQVCESTCRIGCARSAGTPAHKMYRFVLRADVYLQVFATHSFKDCIIELCIAHYVVLTTAQVTIGFTRLGATIIYTVSAIYKLGRRTATQHGM